MLSAARIDEIARHVTGRTLPPLSVDRVETAEANDSEGHAAVRIVIFLKPNVATHLDGEAVLDTLVALNTELTQAGEDRRPLVEYAAVDETDDGGDAES
jgi:hypothetical protein